MKAVLVAFLIVFLAWLTPAANAQSDTPGPDTPVSSDAVPVDTAPADPGYGTAPAPGAAQPSSMTNPVGGARVRGYSGAEGGSQVTTTTTTTVSHQQEAKDRLFVDAIFIAVAVIMCVLAVFLFMSLPKQSKSAGSDNH